MSFCIVYLASPREFRINPTTTRTEVLRVSYHITREHFPTTDVYIFHEDYTEEDKALFPGVKEFIQVDFSTSDYNPSLPRPSGYLMMCRFFCGVLQSYPQLQQYSHYMRLDDDSFFMEPYLTEEKVKQKLLTNQYIYRSLFYESLPQQTLFKFTMYFLEKIAGVDVATMNVLRSLLEKDFFTRKGNYIGLAPYNNFHICPLDLWKLPIVKLYTEAIEREKGYVRYGWLDANVHAMIMFVLSKVDSRIQHALDMNFGYRHNAHVAKVNDYRAVIDLNIGFYPKDFVVPKRDESQTEETK